jgi:hypothetical protein
MSRAPRPFTVYSFSTTHDALSAEAWLKARDFTVLAIPTPRTLGRLCGISLRVDPADAAAVEDALAEARIEIAARGVIEDV